METRFTPPEYHTPIDKPRPLKHKLIPGASLPFLWETMVNSVYWGRRQALKGQFSDPEMAQGAEVVINALEATGAKLHVTGLQHLASTEGAVVFAGNHMSTLETLILPAIIYPYKGFSFVVKSNLVDGRIFGPIMRQLQPIAVGRANPRDDLKKVLSEGKRLVSSGRSVFIFPQTTRSPDFDRAKFNSLGDKLARRGGVMLIPVALKTDFWVPGRILRDFGKVYPNRDVNVAFGPPIDCTGTGRDAHNQTLEFIADQLNSWGVQCR